MPNPPINDIQEVLRVQMAAAMDQHFHRFFGDFDALLAKQVQKFNIQEFKQFIDAIKHIENTKMVKINETSLIYHCLIHLRLKFLTAISVDFHNQFIKTTRARASATEYRPAR